MPDSSCAENDGLASTHSLIHQHTKESGEKICLMDGVSFDGLMAHLCMKDSGRMVVAMATAALLSLKMDFDMKGHGLTMPWKDVVLQR